MMAEPSPGPFRCLGCRSFVTGTEAGHCPRCGLAPPRALAVRSVEPDLEVLRAGDLLARFGPAVLFVALYVKWFLFVSR